MIRHPIALAVLVLCMHGAQAQSSAQESEVNANVGDALQLKASQFLEMPRKAGNKGAASGPQLIFLEGDALAGVVNENAVLTGHAQLRSPRILLSADALEYRQSEDRALARGHVRIQKDGNEYTGDEANINPDTFVGYMTAPTYQFARSNGGGHAERIDFQGKDKATVINGNYTTCLCTRDDATGGSCSAGNKPAWELRASQVDIDTATQEADAHNVQLRFMDVPILALPELGFPLSNARMSGLLPPTIALDSTNGFEYAQPIYWNIAPQMDDTITPAIKTKRGVNLINQFRYLGLNDGGEINAAFMPDDRLRQMSRWGFNGSYHDNLAPLLQLAPGDSLNLNVQLNRVSDGNYWRDFSDINALTQRTLANDWVLNWQDQAGFYASARTLKWQTQQVSESIVTPPYNQLPSLTGGWKKEALQGWSYQAEANVTRFEADPSLTGQPNARRAVGWAQASYAWRQPGWFVIPQARVQWNDYDFSTPLSSGLTHRSFSVPTLSVDSGLLFERSTQFFGRDFVQTLEPRAFYTYTPYRAQNDLPNYDSSLKDFNFTSIYTANEFNGKDRVADDNLLTLGVQSRFINPQDGAELLRLAYAQRLRYKDRQVVLPGDTPDNSRISDMLFGAQLHLTSRWSLDSVVQYNPKLEQSERSTFGLAYHPNDYHTLSVAYRYQRGQSKLLDVGWQWPLNRPFGSSAGPVAAGQGLGAGRWYGVGRLYYSVPDKKPIDALLGVEYDGGCWIGRVALERGSTIGSLTSTRALFQLEFVGFSKIGSSPLQSLQEWVPRYQTLRSKSNTQQSMLPNFE